MFPLDQNGTVCKDSELGGSHSDVGKQRPCHREASSDKRNRAPARELPSLMGETHPSTRRELSI